MRFGIVFFIIALLLVGIAINSNIGLGVNYGNICKEVNFDDSKGGFCYDFRNASGYIDRNVWNITNTSGSVVINSSGLWIGDSTDAVRSKQNVYSPTTFNITHIVRGAAFTLSKNNYMISQGVYGAAGYAAIVYIAADRIDIYADTDYGGVDEQSIAAGFIPGHYDNITMSIGIGAQRQVNFTRNSTQIGVGNAKTKATAWNQPVGWKMDADSWQNIQWIMSFNGSVMPQGEIPETFQNRSWNITSNNTLGYGVVENSETWNDAGTGNISRNLLTLSVTASAPSNMTCVLDNNLAYTAAVAANINYLAPTINATSHAYVVYDNISIGDHCLYCSFKVTSTGSIFASGCLKVHRISPYFTFVRQFPSDLTVFSSIGGVNASFNITSDIGVNVSMVNLSVDVNGTFADRSISYVVNGTAFRGFRFDADLKSNKSGVWDFFLDDNKIIPATYNIDEHFLENTPHTAYLPTTSSDWAAVGLLNVSSSINFGFFEAMASSSGVLRFYYCNSSFDWSSVVGNDNCAFFGNHVGSVYNHSHGPYSNHSVIPFAVMNGSINGVGVTSNSTFMIRGDVGGKVYYIPYSSNPFGFRYSSNNGNSWTGIPGYTWDAHLHQISNYSQVFYRAWADDVAGDQNFSVVVSDFLALSDLPPTSPFVFNPTLNLQVSGISVQANWTSCQSPTNLSIVNYTFALYDGDCDVLNSTFFNTTFLNATFNSTAFPDGNYTVRVTCFDNESRSSFGCSDNFFIDNFAPFCNYSWPNESYYNYSVAWINYSFANASSCFIGIGENLSVNCGSFAHLAVPSSGWNNWSVFAYDLQGSYCVDNSTFFYNVSAAPSSKIKFGVCNDDSWSVLLYFLIAILAVGLLLIAVMAKDRMLQGFLLVFAGVMFIFFAYYVEACVEELFFILWVVGVICCLFGVFRAFFRWL